MPIFTIPPWNVKGSMDQRQTRWEFTDDAEGKIVIKNVVTTGNDMFILKDTGAYPNKKIIYLRPVRVFDSSEIPLERVAIPITTEVCNNVIYRDGANVKEPLVFMNEEEYNDPNSPDFSFYTSEFFATQDYHLCSNWIITDADGNVIVSYLRNKFNKTSIRIPKSKVETYSYFNVKVQHVTNTGLESSFGVLEVYKNTGEQFQVIKSIENVNAEEDLNIYLSPESVFSSDILVGIYLRSLGGIDGEMDKVTIPIPRSNPIVIPNRHLRNDSTYYLDIFSRDASNNLIKTVITIKTQITEELPATPVDGLIEKVGTYSGLNLPTGFCTQDYLLGNMLLPNTGNAQVKVNTIRQYTAIDGIKYRLTIGASDRNDVTLPTPNNDNVFFRLNKGYLIVDTLNDQTKPMFQVFSYNVLLDEFTLLHFLNREETISIGYDNNAFFYNEKLYYKISNTKKIMEYDYINNSLSLFLELEDELIDSNLIYNPIYEKVLLSCRDGFFRVLDMKSKTIESGSAIDFSNNSGERFKSFQLANGDSLVINISLTNEISEIMHYDARTSSLKQLDKSVFNFKKHSGVINSLYNSVFILQSEDETRNNQELYRFY